MRKMLEELDGGDDGASKSSAIDDDDDPQNEEDDEPVNLVCFDDDLFFDIFEFRIKLRGFFLFFFFKKRYGCIIKIERAESKTQ